MGFELTKLFVSFGADQGELKSAMTDAKVAVDALAARSTLAADKTAQALTGAAAKVKQGFADASQRSGQAFDYMTDNYRLNAAKLMQATVGAASRISESLAPGSGEIIQSLVAGIGLAKIGMNLLGQVSKQTQKSVTDTAEAATTGFNDATTAVSTTNAAVGITDKLLKSTYAAVLGYGALFIAAIVAIIVIISKLNAAHKEKMQKIIAENDAEIESINRVLKAYTELAGEKLKGTNDSQATRIAAIKEETKALLAAAEARKQKAYTENETGSSFRVDSKEYKERNEEINSAYTADATRIRKLEELKFRQLNEMIAEERRKIAKKYAQDTEDIQKSAQLIGLKGRARDVGTSELEFNKSVNTEIATYDASDKAAGTWQAHLAKLKAMREKHSVELSELNREWDRKELAEKRTFEERLLAMQQDVRLSGLKGITRELRAEEVSLQRERIAAINKYETGEKRPIDRQRMEEELGGLDARSAARKREMIANWKDQERSAMQDIQDRYLNLTTSKMDQEQQRYAREVENIKKMSQLHAGATQEEQKLYEQALQFKLSIAKKIHEEEMVLAIKAQREARNSFVNDLTGYWKSKNFRPSQFQDITEVSRQILTGSGDEAQPTVRELVKAAKQREDESRKQDKRSKEVIDAINQAGLGGITPK